MIVCYCFPVNIVKNKAYAASKVLTGQQIADYCNGRVGQSYASNSCLAFVRECFMALGAEQSSDCCAWNYGNKYCTHTSRNDIPIGADVFFNSEGTKVDYYAHGHHCGHIGIYVGDGYIVHAYSSKIQKMKIDTVISHGYIYRGWGVHGNVTLSNVPMDTGMSISGQTAPTGNLKQGANFGLYGTISSNLPIQKVWGGIYKQGTDTAVQYVEDTPGSTSYSLHGKFNNNLIFDNLAAGNYTYKIYAKDSQKTYTLINSDFSVGTVLTSSMSISGQTAPSGKLQQGKFFAIKGIISSNLNITKVWGGVYVRNGSATAQYAEATPNSTKYDLSTYFDNKIIFNNLAVGYYTYKIQATDSSGKTYTLVNSDFQIGEPDDPVDIKVSVDKIELNLTDKKSQTITVTYSGGSNIPNGGMRLYNTTYVDQYVTYTHSQSGNVITITFTAIKEGNVDVGFGFANRDTDEIIKLVKVNINVEGDPTVKGHEMTSSEAAGRTIPDGDYWICSALNQQYFLDIPGNEISKSGTNVNAWTWGNEMPSQYDVWTIKYLNNGFYKITQKNSSLALDVKDGTLDRGANVWLYNDNGTPAQQWSITRTSKGYTLQSRCCSFYLDIYDAKVSNGTNVLIWEGNGNQNQNWGFIPYNPNSKPIKNGTYRILTSSGTDYNLDASGVGKNGEYKDGTNIQIWDTGNDDLFVLEYESDGYYRIKEAYSNLYVEVVNEQSKFLNSGQNVILHSKTNSRGQLWMLMSAGNNKYFIVNKLSGYYLDLLDGKCKNGQNVSQVYYLGGAPQQWSFVQEFTVNFDANGGKTSTTSKKVITTKKYGELPTPTKEGYNFNGWYTDKTAGSKITADTTVNISANQTLYAHWSPKTISVIFHRNTNENDASSIKETFTYGIANQRFGYKTDGSGRYSKMNAENIGFGEWTNPGYELLGWSSQKNSGSRQYSTYSGVSDAWITEHSPSIDLYAQWKINKVNVYYNANGGMITDGGDYYLGTDSYVFTSKDNKILDNYWEYNQKYENGLYNASTFKLSRDGYTFVGWSLNKDGGKIFDQDNNTISANDLYPDITTKGGTITLYAQWISQTGVFKGSGTYEDPYQITSKADLAKMRDLVNDPIQTKVYGYAFYAQTADIDLENEEWIPIGNRMANGKDLSVPLFYGSYNGYGHSIKNLNVNETEGNKYSGLFGSFRGDGIIENLIVYGSVKSNGGAVGGIAGEIVNGGGTIRNCAFIGDVTGYYSVGGISGVIYQSGLIENCYHNGNVSKIEKEDAGRIGGIVGELDAGYFETIVGNAIVRNCYNVGNVNGKEESVGSIVGYMNLQNKSQGELSVINCYSIKGQADIKANGTYSTYDVVQLNDSTIKKIADDLGEPFITDIDGSINDGYPVFNWQTDAVSLMPLMIDETDIVLEIGKQFEIKANQDNLTFISNKPNIASVDELTGIITALAEGKAIISVVNNDGDVVQLNVTVVPESLNLNKLGDVNLDGMVTAADATAILQYIGNRDKYQLNEQQKKNADVDGVEGITAMDALILQQLDAGIYQLTDLPIQK